MVITKGAGRIAEVAARFTLDAMPGKQMSIDADLNTGLIDEQEARERRELISREAEYYGSMDGANKFVRGDAVAGIIITLINIIGGLAIGVFQNNMSFSQAAENYTLLTIGDGLVTQIPALIISTAAGIIVSRAGNKSSLGHEITSQLLFQPRAVGIAAGVLFCFGLVPGLPTIPFTILAIFTGALAYISMQAVKESQQIEEEQRIQEEQAVPAEHFDTLPPLDTLAVEVGYGLIPLVDVEQDGQLLERIKSIRRQMANDIGIIVAPIHIQEYCILLKGNEIARGELMTNYYLAMNPGAAEEQIDGIPTREPTYGLPALWIKENIKEDALAKGYTVVDLATVMITHLSDVIRRHSCELLGRQEAQQLLDTIRETHPKVVEELIPNLLPLGGVVKVLQNLLKEQVPIRDLLAILETLADWAPMTKDLDLLTEKARQSLARTISKLYLSPEGVIPAVTLRPAVESVIAEAIQQSEHGSMLALDPATDQPLLMCSSQIRMQFKRLVERFIPNIIIISYDEILNTAEIKSLGTVELSNAD
jgi:flagellar biosynthesis protein FlhA